MRPEALKSARRREPGARPWNQAKNRLYEELLDADPRMTPIANSPGVPCQSTRAAARGAGSA